MRIALAVTLLLALAAPAQALTEKRARAVTAEFGQWSVRSGDADSYNVGRCWHRDSGAVRCRLTEHWPEGPFGLPEGSLTTKVHVTRMDGRLCARDTLYAERPARYDCR